jgi:hypothetical protein
MLAANPFETITQIVPLPKNVFDGWRVRFSFKWELSFMDKRKRMNQTAPIETRALRMSKACGIIHNGDQSHEIKTQCIRFNLARSGCRSRFGGNPAARIQ